MDAERNEPGSREEELVEELQEPTCSLDSLCQPQRDSFMDARVGSQSS